MSSVLRVIFAILLALPSITAFSQISVLGKSKVCLGDLVFLNYAPPSGKTVKNYNWDFGDSYTSNDSTPTHLYKNRGIFIVQLVAAFTDGSQRSDSIKIQVIDLPKARLVYSSGDSCLFSNNLCFKDRTSRSADNYSITKRIIVWGDGTQTISTSPESENSICHKYQKSDRFYIEMEVTDQMGCKSTTSSRVRILEDVEAKFDHKVTYPDCESARICHVNKSKASLSAKYVWLIDGQTSTQPHFGTDSFCTTMKSSGYSTAQLKATSPDGCTDIIAFSQKIEIKEGKRAVSISDSSICLGDGSIVAWVDAIGSEKVEWFFGGEKRASGRDLIYNLKENKIPPGKYELICEITRGGCQQEVRKPFSVMGPLAQMKIFNSPQCGVNRRVFFVERSKYVDTANTSFTWWIEDPAGDTCIINRSLNQNKYRNCNTTVGWFAKHDYTYPKSGNHVVLQVYDAATGCSDLAAGNVNLTACGACQPYDGMLQICQNQTFLPGDRRENDPFKFSLDSGKTWLPYPSKLGTEYEGIYDLGLIYRWSMDEWAEDYGDDSIRIHTGNREVFDTVFAEKAVKVKRIKTDKPTITFSKSCDPREAIVRFEKGVFLEGERFQITWGDNEQSNALFMRDSFLKEIRHTYDEAGLQGEIVVTLFSVDGCDTSYRKSFDFGYTSRISAKGLLCKGKEFCAYAIVQDFSTKKYWDEKNGFGEVRWILDGKELESKEFELCMTFDKPGSHDLNLVSLASSGCFDTTTLGFAIQEVKAGVKEASKLHYCKGLREFQDSSSLAVTNAGDRITTFKWDFGTGKFSTLEKNPVMAFDGMFKTQVVRHVAISNGGCTDTTEFTLRILTSRPGFELRDSIGCAPFRADFVNTSEGSTHYIWEFGDEDNTTTQTHEKGIKQFTYGKPGRYYARLVGIDSFFNAITGNIYYCHTVYPGSGSLGVPVIVMPNAHPGILGPDTLCAGDEGIFTSLSGDDYDYDIWQFDNDDTLHLEPGSQLSHKYDRKGVYALNLRPVFYGHEPTPGCFSEIEKTIVVYDVRASFDIDPGSKNPVLDFINYSTPITADFLWDFGHPSSGVANHSQRVNPRHNYGRDTGWYNACLVASLPSGCKDSVCKPIFNDYQNELKVYNVFTPGNPDGLNDVFEITLEGEDYYDLTIFNRWGEQVLATGDQNDPQTPIVWNGRINNTGDQCPSGTYFYVLKYSYRNKPGEHQVQEGTVTLIR